jgi:hypothetical protein
MTGAFRRGRRPSTRRKRPSQPNPRLASSLPSVVAGGVRGERKALEFPVHEGRLWLTVALFVSRSIGNSFFGMLQQARVVEAAPASGSALLALNTSAIFAAQAEGP